MYIIHLASFTIGNEDVTKEYNNLLRSKSRENDVPRFPLKNFTYT